ncbi:MAG TPA: hypothetical protein VK707_07945 [Solirubrobacteraceae bacterium]|nr:hypothetical protein [Solirubrobacteraceae bacterium]
MTVTGVTALAVPENDGVVLFERGAGWFNVTVDGNALPENGSVLKRPDALTGASTKTSKTPRVRHRQALGLLDREFACTTHHSMSISLHWPPASVGATQRRPRVRAAGS